MEMSQANNKGNSHVLAAEILASIDTTKKDAKQESSVEKPLVDVDADESPSDIKNASDHSASASFPEKLMKIISDERNSSAISWLPEGNGFSISNRKKMNEEILPQYFKRSKYSSFTRKLNRWGFTCFTRGIGNCIYHHTHFHRDKPELVMKMCCSNSPSTFARAKQDQDVRIRDFQPATFEDHETAKNRVVRSLHAPPAVVSPDSILDPLLRMPTVNNVGLIPSQLQDGMALRGINPWNLSNNLASNILQNTTPSPLNYSYLNSTIMNIQNNNAQLQNMMLLNSLNLSHQLQVQGQGGQGNLMYAGNNDARQELLKQLLNSNL